ncbi:hypothetical protein BJ742DRAFT_65085 [Cladochytrium replicatum]|nr:hypothetical protein BJ742DRAFT_65085 [Cladochytrium replicatum]
MIDALVERAVQEQSQPIRFPSPVPLSPARDMQIDDLSHDTDDPFEVEEFQVGHALDEGPSANRALLHSPRANANSASRAFGRRGEDEEWTPASKLRRSDAPRGRGRGRPSKRSLLGPEFEETIVGVQACSVIDDPNLAATLSFNLGCPFWLLPQNLMVTKPKEVEQPIVEKNGLSLQTSHNSPKALAHTNDRHIAGFRKQKVFDSVIPDHNTATRNSGFPKLSNIRSKYYSNQHSTKRARLEFPSADVPKNKKARKSGDFSNSSAADNVKAAKGRKSVGGKSSDVRPRRSVSSLRLFNSIPGAIPTCRDHIVPVFCYPGSKRGYWWAGLLVPYSYCNARQFEPKGFCKNDDVAVLFAEFGTKNLQWINRRMDELRIFDPKSEPYCTFQKAKGFTEDTLVKTISSIAAASTVDRKTWHDLLGAFLLDDILIEKCCCPVVQKTPDRNDVTIEDFGQLAEDELANVDESLADYNETKGLRGSASQSRHQNGHAQTRSFFREVPITNQVRMTNAPIATSGTLPSPTRHHTVYFSVQRSSIYDSATLHDITQFSNLFLREPSSRIASYSIDERAKSLPPTPVTGRRETVAKMILSAGGSPMQLNSVASSADLP